GGFGLAGFGSMQSTLVFLSAPPEARSRMMGLVSVCIGAAPLGLLHVGWLGDTFGTEIALMVTSGWGLVATLAIIALSSRRR
ncbi:MAG: MFS transporter, partial [Rhodospirillaceae bacterium]|nr:MFS transporter [Rhodospirillaceae bacterium]